MIGNMRIQNIKKEYTKQKQEEKQEEITPKIFIDFGSTELRINLNGKLFKFPTIVKKGDGFYEEIFENIKRDWLLSKMNEVALYNFFTTKIKTIPIYSKNTEIIASTPSIYIGQDVIKYKNFLSSVFNLPTKQITIISESTAILNGSECRYSKDVIVADIGGFTTDLINYKYDNTTNRENTNIKGYKLGGELITSKIAHFLYDNNFISNIDYIYAKNIKELFITDKEHYNKELFNLLSENPLQNVNVSISKLNDLITNEFTKVYKEIVNKINSMDLNGTAKIVFCGKIANIEYFQKFINNYYVGRNIEFITDVDCLINGLQKNISYDPDNFLREDIYTDIFLPRTWSNFQKIYLEENKIQHDTGVPNIQRSGLHIKEYIKVGNAGDKFPITIHLGEFLHNPTQDLSVELLTYSKQEKKFIPFQNHIISPTSKKVINITPKIVTVKLVITKDDMEVLLNEEIQKSEIKNNIIIQNIVLEEELKKIREKTISEYNKGRNEKINNWKKEINFSILSDEYINDLFTKTSKVGGSLSNNYLIPEINDHEILSTKNENELIKLLQSKKISLLGIGSNIFNQTKILELQMKKDQLQTQQSQIYNKNKFQKVSISPLLMLKQKNLSFQMIYEQGKYKTKNKKIIKINELFLKNQPVDNLAQMRLNMVQELCLLIDNANSISNVQKKLFAFNQKKENSNITTHKFNISKSSNEKLKIQNEKLKIQKEI